MDLLGNRIIIAPAPKTNDRVEQRSGDEKKDDHRRPQGPVEHLKLLLGDVSFRIKRVLIAAEGAAANEEGSKDEQEQSCRQSRSMPATKVHNLRYLLVPCITS